MKDHSFVFGTGKVSANPSNGTAVMLLWIGSKACTLVDSIGDLGTCRQEIIELSKNTFVVE